MSYRDLDYKKMYYNLLEKNHQKDIAQTQEYKILLDRIVDSISRQICWNIQKVLFILFYVLIPVALPVIIIVLAAWLFSSGGCTAPIN